MNERLIELVSEILDVEQREISSSSGRDDVEAWDSLNHLRLVTAVEQEFNVKLSMSEIERIDTFGALQSLIEERA